MLPREYLLVTEIILEGTDTTAWYDWNEIADMTGGKHSPILKVRFTIFWIVLKFSACQPICHLCMALLYILVPGGHRIDL